MPEIIPQGPKSRIAAFDRPAATTAVPRISCIIPTLERGEVLCDTVCMLLNQAPLPHEIIVVDQTMLYATTPQRRLAEWAATDRILWLRQRQPNASRARNTGALAATGDFVLFLDDDIRIGPDFLAAYTDVLQRTGAAGVSGPVLEGDRNLMNQLSAKAFTSELGWLLYFPKNYGLECETSFMMSGNVAIRRELFLALGGMDENYDQGAHREESDFAMRFRQADYRFRYDPRCVVYHLGPSIVPGGGARTGTKGKDFRYFHHCVGDWYFNLKFSTVRTVFPLLVASLRHFVFTRKTFDRPWRFPLALAYWMLALPPALVKRARGAKLLPPFRRATPFRSMTPFSSSRVRSTPCRLASGFVRGLGSQRNARKMRILVHGRFYPSIGGIETVVHLLAREWVAAGQEPVVVSNLPAEPEPTCAFPFRLVYTPGPVAWWRLVKWADVVLQMNLSLKAAWPHMLLRRPLIISHQSCYRSYRSYSSYSPSWRERLKLRCMSGATNIAASQAISRALSESSKIIPNPYDSAVFSHHRSVSRDCEIIFVGRLVSEKGVDLLLEAMKYFQPPWKTARLSVVGDGPERVCLQRQATKLGLARQVTFLGALDQHRVARELCRHKILVIPSVYEEPFGVVALEGAASGCLVLGSDGGGLSEAIGPAGTTFRPGDAVDLASQLMRLLAADAESEVQPEAVSEHLKRHQAGQIASEYLKVFLSVRSKE